MEQAIEKKSRHWLIISHLSFFERTGVNEANLRFCRDRQGKAPICKQLGITYFVDDRLEVLRYLYPEVANLYLLNSDESEVNQHRDSLNRVKRVPNWSEILDDVIHAPVKP